MSLVCGNSIIAFSYALLSAPKNLPSVWCSSFPIIQGLQRESGTAEEEENGVEGS